MIMCDVTQSVRQRALQMWLEAEDHWERQLKSRDAGKEAGQTKTEVKRPRSGSKEPAGKRPEPADVEG
jgi:hypothetical protein